MIDLPIPTTLEMAQEQILTLQEAHTQLTTDNETLTGTLESERSTHTAEIADRDAKITALRDHNQKLFLRASAAIIEPPTGGEEPTEPKTADEELADFAKTLKGVF